MFLRPNNQGFAKLIILVLLSVSVIALFFVVGPERLFFGTNFRPNDDSLREIQVLDEDLDDQLLASEDWSELPDVATIMTGLNIPWDLAFLPGGGMLITERPGNLLLRAEGGSINNIELPRTVASRGEGGLLGLTLHPDFSNNGWLYLYMTIDSDGQGTKNAVLRYRFDGQSLANELVILTDIPGALYHDGGRLEFGPDGKLYVTTGDAQNPDLAQDLDSLAGKTLRVNDDGSIPEDNPFSGSPVYSYGHRNSQGLAWDSRGQLWSTEHGRTTATLTGMDEINLILPGENYGWPEIEGDQTRPGMKRPIIHSGPDVTWAPASALYYNGSIFFGGLRGASIYEAVLSPGNTVASIRRYFYQDFGRIRTIRQGPDNYFYITTSNRDGRGQAGPEDDRIIRINPRVFR